MLFSALTSLIETSNIRITGITDSADPAAALAVFLLNVLRQYLKLITPIINNVRKITLRKENRRFKKGERSHRLISWDLSTGPFHFILTEFHFQPGRPGPV